MISSAWNLETSWGRFSTVLFHNLFRFCNIDIQPNTGTYDAISSSHTLTMMDVDLMMRFLAMIPSNNERTRLRKMRGQLMRIQSRRLECPPPPTYSPGMNVWSLPPRLDLFFMNVGVMSLLENGPTRNISKLINIVLQFGGKSWDEEKAAFLSQIAEGSAFGERPLYPTYASYTMLLDYCAKAGWSDSAKALEEKMIALGLPIDRSSLRRTMQILASKGNVDGVKSLMQNLSTYLRYPIKTCPAFKSSPYHQSAGISEQLSGMSIGPILSEDEQIKTWSKPKLGDFNLLLIAVNNRLKSDRRHSNADSSMNISKLTEEMLHCYRTMFDTGNEPNSLTHNTMFDFFLTSGDRARAEALFETMEAESKTNAQSYNILLQHVLDGDLSDKEETPEEKQHYRWLPQRRFPFLIQKKQIFPDRVMQAMRIFDQLLHEGPTKGVIPDNWTFTLMMEACADVGFVIAGARYRDFYLDGIAPILTKEGKPFRRELNAVDVLGPGLHQLAATEGEARNRPFQSISLSVWNAVIRTYALGKDGVGAIARFEEMKDLGLEPNVATFRNLLSAIAQHNGSFRCSTIRLDDIDFDKSQSSDFKAALMLHHFRKIKTQQDQFDPSVIYWMIRGLLPDIWQMSKKSRSMASDKPANELEFWVDQVQQPFTQDDETSLMSSTSWGKTSAQTIKPLKLSERLDVALFIFQHRPKDAVFPADGYNKLLFACCSERRIETALQIFREMVEKHQPLRYIVYERLVQVLLHEHYFDEAIRIYELLSLQYGMDNSASMTFRNQNPRTRSFLFNTLIQQAVRRARPGLAINLFKAMYSTAEPPRMSASEGSSRRVQREYLPQFPNAFTINFLLIGLLPHVDTPSRAPLTYTQMTPLPNYELPDHLSIKGLAAVSSKQTQFDFETSRPLENLNDSVEERARAVIDMILRYFFSRKLKPDHWTYCLLIYVMGAVKRDFSSAWKVWERYLIDVQLRRLPPVSSSELHDDSRSSAATDLRNMLDIKTVHAIIHTCRGLRQPDKLVSVLSTVQRLQIPMRDLSVAEAFADRLEEWTNFKQAAALREILDEIESQYGLKRDRPKFQTQLEEPWQLNDTSENARRSARELVDAATLWESAEFQLATPKTNVQ
ncbi:hypothetical protein BJ742DRAFT_787846 [Cladochytrium replicatum]|nr:hypothetical protein BJ742DRAFT_787846 [Cladochytrium replicatum]